MDPFNLPATTEYTYAHSFQPHPYLHVSSGAMIPPIHPFAPTNTNFTLAELQTRPDLMPTPESLSTRPERRTRATSRSRRKDPTTNA